MDWRAVLTLATNIIPGLREAIAWLNHHVENYEVYQKENEVIIRIQVDNDNDAKQVSEYMDMMLKTLIPKIGVKRVRRVIIK